MQATRIRNLMCKEERTCVVKIIDVNRVDRFDGRKLLVKYRPPSKRCQSTMTGLSVAEAPILIPIPIPVRRAVLGAVLEREA